MRRSLTPDAPCFVLFLQAQIAPKLARWRALQFAVGGRGEFRLTVLVVSDIGCHCTEKLDVRPLASESADFDRERKLKLKFYPACLQAL